MMNTIKTPSTSGQGSLIDELRPVNWKINYVNLIIEMILSLHVLERINLIVCCCPAANCYLCK